MVHYEDSISPVSTTNKQLCIACTTAVCCCFCGRTAAGEGVVRTVL